MKREVELAKRLLESKGYQVLSEADFNADDFRARRAAAFKNRDERRAARENPANQMIEKIRSSEDPISTAFEELVPTSGHADTVAGELVRAMMRLMYRDWNDGDVFYEGYGRETCLASAIFLCQKLDLFDDFDRAANMQLQDDKYTKFLEGIRDKVLNAIYENPSLLTEKNTEDSLDTDTDIDGVDEWEPKYEVEIDFPDDLIWHIEQDHVSLEDIMSNMEMWDYVRDGEIANINDYGVLIVDLPRESYDELEASGRDWMDSYAADLNSEYGSPSDDEDYDDDEEEYDEDEDEEY